MVSLPNWKRKRVEGAAEEEIIEAFIFIYSRRRILNYSHLWLQGSVSATTALGTFQSVAPSLYTAALSRRLCTERDRERERKKNICWDMTRRAPVREWIQFFGKRIRKKKKKKRKKRRTDGRATITNKKKERERGKKTEEKNGNGRSTPPALTHSRPTVPTA